MQPLKKRIAYEVILGLAVAICLALLLRQSRRIAEYQRLQAADAQSLRLLRQALGQKGSQIAPPVAEEASGGDNHAGIAKREAVIARLDRELAETRANLTDLQMQLSTARVRNAKASADAADRLQKLQADTHAQLDDLQQKLKAAQTESDIAHQRLTVLEADNAQMKTDFNTSSERAAEVSRIVAALQDIDRRRDVYLTSILRRYRDIGSEFRAMGAVIDTTRDSGSDVCNGAALSRIQSAVSSAEDDLRQVGELDARSQKLEKQLLKK